MTDLQAIHPEVHQAFQCDTHDNRRSDPHIASSCDCARIDKLHHVVIQHTNEVCNKRKENIRWTKARMDQGRS